MSPLDPSRVRRLAGFGGVCRADAYVMAPESEEEVASCLEAARRTGRRVVLRGEGRSYGDAAIAAEQIALDLSAMRGLSWVEEGVAEIEAGATFDELWRWALPQGWWPPVVAGTSFISLGGALAMNVHGKNAWRTGPLGDHVESLDVMLAGGSTRTLLASDPEFAAVVSGAGLLGVILRARLRMKEVASGWLDVSAVPCRNWEAQFAAFEEHQDSADYMVSWVDCFCDGRGLFHSARHASDGGLDEEDQLPAGRLFGLVPHGQAWRALRLLNRRSGMRLVNAARHFAGAAGRGRPRTSRETLGAFSFLLDAVPEWRRAYDPGGFVQFQSFVPAGRAPEVFAAQVRLQREERLEAFLGVLKRHRADRYLLSYGVDGYSLALDLKVTAANRCAVWALCHRMAELALDAGGRFYLAKDATLTAGQFARSLGDSLASFRAHKQAMDPGGLFTSAQAVRLGLA